MAKPRLYYNCNPASKLVFVLIVHFYRFKFVPLNLGHYIYSVCIRGFQWSFGSLQLFSFYSKPWQGKRNWSPGSSPSYSLLLIGLLFWHRVQALDRWKPASEPGLLLWSAICWLSRCLRALNPCQFFFILFLLSGPSQIPFFFLLNIPRAVVVCFQVWKGFEVATSQG